MFSDSIGVMSPATIKSNNESQKVAESAQLLLKSNQSFINKQEYAVNHQARSTNTAVN
jgi:hypothetical protein